MPSLSGMNMIFVHGYGCVNECVGSAGNVPVSSSSDTMSTLLEYSSTKLPIPSRNRWSCRTCAPRVRVEYRVANGKRRAFG